jgi:hypothetical protein
VARIHGAQHFGPIAAYRLFIDGNKRTGLPPSLANLFAELSGKFVEHRDASLDEGAAVRRRLDPLTVAIEQAHAERMVGAASS